MLLNLRAPARAPLTLPLPGNGWFHDRPVASASQSHPIDTLIASPWMPTETCRVDQVAFRITGGAAGFARLGFYAADRAAGWLPGDRLLDVVTDIDTTASNQTVLLTLPAPLTLVRGRLVWRAIVFSGGPTTTSWPINVAGGGGYWTPLGAQSATQGVGNTAGLTGARFVRDAALTYVIGSAFLPASFGAGTSQNGQGAPLFSMRKAA
jgi:hypothetical protein